MNKEEFLVAARRLAETCGIGIIHVRLVEHFAEYRKKHEQQIKNTLVPFSIFTEYTHLNAALLQLAMLLDSKEKTKQHSLEQLINDALEILHLFSLNDQARIQTLVDEQRLCLNSWADTIKRIKVIRNCYVAHLAKKLPDKKQFERISKNDAWQFLLLFQDIERILRTWLRLMKEDVDYSFSQYQIGMEVRRLFQLLVGGLNAEREDRIAKRHLRYSPSTS